MEIKAILNILFTEIIYHFGLAGPAGIGADLDRLAGGGVMLYKETTFEVQNVSGNFPSGQPATTAPIVVRQEFPETWIWEEVNK